MSVRRTVPAVFGLVAAVCLAHPSLAGTKTVGCIATAGDGPSITGPQLRSVLDTFVPPTNAHSTLVVLAQCYGGDLLGDLASRANTTVLSATSPGEEAVYGGYDDDAATALRPGPGRTSDDVHAAGVAGKDPSENPQQQGPVFTLDPLSPTGPVKSRHVVDFAGLPDEGTTQDSRQRDRMRANLRPKPGQSETSASFTAVGDEARHGWQKPGTLEGLRAALREVATRMGPQEQFILWVGDHGCQQEVDDAPACTPTGCTSAPLAFTPATVDHMTSDPANRPTVDLLSPGPTSPAPVDIVLSAQTVVGVPFSNPVDLDGDGALTGPGEGWQARAPLDESLIDFSGEVVTVVGTGLALSEIALDTGDIEKPRRRHDPAGAPQDPFLCYQTRSAEGATPTPSQSVSLADAFQTGTFTTGRMAELCLPADVNGEGNVDVVTHLGSHKLAGGPAPVTRQTHVANQLGDFQVRTTRATSLLVPTAKGLVAAPPPPDDALHGVDRYECYPARLVPGTAGLLPGGQLVVADQFESRLYDVRRVTRLCNPVDMNGQGIKNATGRLLCVAARRAAGEPRHTPRRGVFVSNELGATRIDTVHEVEICIPSVVAP